MVKNNDYGFFLTYQVVKSFADVRVRPLMTA